VIRALATLADVLRPELLAWALASMRVLPVALLCPVLGGQLAPAPVRLVVAGSLGLALAPLAAPVPGGSVEIGTRCLREAALGLLIGLAAALPFDAARIGGRLVDLVRGTSAEAALPVAGHRESASGDVLHQLLLALALAGGALPGMLGALGRSMVLVPPGGASVGAEGALALARAVGIAVATGLAVAAPVIALSWATDAAVGLVLRAAPGIPAGELGTPVRILGGATVLWLSLGLVADRLLREVAPEAGLLRTVLGP
jgi:flagellar biosynthetic protein FliR/type III secretion protein T